MVAGIEPDDCFYIQNYKAVIGKTRLDLSQDPPPDLALESDLTSETETDAYEALGVPELWIYSRIKLTINVLQEGKYIESLISPTFPNVAVIEIIPQYVERAKIVGASQALYEFELFVNASRGVSHRLCPQGLYASSLGVGNPPTGLDSPPARTD